MRGHNICFCGEILKIIPKLLLLPFLSRSLFGVDTLGRSMSADYILSFLFFSVFTNNSLGTIEGAIFGGTSSVGRDLYLDTNSLTSISNDAFDNVVLTYIRLSDNLLTGYPQALLSQNPERM